MSKFISWARAKLGIAKQVMGIMQRITRVETDIGIEMLKVKILLRNQAQTVESNTNTTNQNFVEIQLLLDAVLEHLGLTKEFSETVDEHGEEHIIVKLTKKQ